jgi:hypothetical protein
MSDKRPEIMTDGDRLAWLERYPVATGWLVGHGHYASRTSCDGRQTLRGWGPSLRDAIDDLRGKVAWDQVAYLRGAHATRHTDGPATGEGGSDE